jgi:hypothetical protein
MSSHGAASGRNSTPAISPGRSGGEEEFVDAAVRHESAEQGGAAFM